ncbi:hypothetical protein BCR39DRAFT_550185 [Naematelia encephala]|uniref:Uncharacterized protein n=1 Tax=Naematelia encephala TaxID=71784 RepID=A0A1Y2AM84_9TREE|nr:hypothetical protein BCR39DRAFT_550185 [Naematelia encephala]
MSSLTTSKPKLLDAQQVPAQATSIVNASKSGSGRGSITSVNATDAPPIAIASRGQGQGAGRPINAANAMRARGLMVPPHAVTPGNTPNSLDTIRRRIASTVNGTARDGQGNKIAPSYE